jgi:spermidine/putrescine transport system substrate-binding protein
MMTISRRTLMQTMGAGAVALGTPLAFAAREKEMNILCWEGYNSGQILDPFRLWLADLLGSPAQTVQTKR